MDQRKPISFLSVKCIIPYMNVNFRTIYAPHFPSLLNIQKSFPLKFDLLKLDNTSFTLDNTNYSFNLVMSTLSGGTYGKHILLYDVDEFGVEVFNSELMLGDIEIAGRQPNLSIRRQSPFNHVFISYVICKVCSKNNEIQTASSRNGIKLRDLIRKQIIKILGGKHVHQVKHLKIETSDGILRLPEGLKLKIRELSVQEYGNRVINAILPILDASSFPLESLSVNAVHPGDPVFQNEILRASESLIIRKWGFSDSMLGADLLITLPNKNIYLENEIPMNEIVSLAQNWMQHHRVIGTKFSMQSESVNEYLLEIKKELGAAQGVFSEKKCNPSFSCYILPLNPTSQLNIYEEKLTEEKLRLLVMEVMPIKSAKSYSHRNETLKCIIQYMNINFRTIHSPHFPSLRDIQQMLPLRIDLLKMDKASFTLDNTTHSFYTVLDALYRYPPLPTTVETVREYRGIPYDVNEYGQEDTSHSLMPGDIVIEDREHPILRELNLFPEQQMEFNSFVFYIIDWGENNDVLAASSPYGVKLRDTIRKKLDEVLGGTRVHQVKHLKITIPHGILRLPKGLKLKIQELSVMHNSNAVIDAIIPILDASSFPLKSLSIEAERPSDAVFKHEILRNSEILNIKYKEDCSERWADLLISLPNKKIHFKHMIPLEDVISLARNWVEFTRSIGTRFSMQSVSAMRYLIWLQEKLRAQESVIPDRRCSQFPICYTLPMNSTSELNIFGYKSPNHEEELIKCNGQPLMIVLEVMPIGSAQPRQ